MQRIAILGLGLIGGSLGLALKASRLRDVEFAGYDLDDSVARRAQRLGAVDHVGSDARVAVKGASIVIIATPIAAVPEVLKEIAEALPDNCVVTDTASTKAEVMRWASEFLPDKISFVGGHPMAGKEQSGIDVAEAKLFDGRAYCVVPSVNAKVTAVNTVVGLARLVGAEPVFMDAEEHDSYVASISHLPLIVSTALFDLARESPAWPEISRLASSGFRDVTRLASGDPELSEDICITNRDNVLHWIDRMIEELRRWRGLIKSAEEDELFKAFARVQFERDTFMQTGAKVREQMSKEAAAEISGLSVTDLLVGEWAAKRTREVIRTTEEQAAEQRLSRRSRRPEIKR